MYKILTRPARAAIFRGRIRGGSRGTDWYRRMAQIVSSKDCKLRIGAIISIQIIFTLACLGPDTCSAARMELNKAFRVIYVIDGDSLMAERGRNRVEIRLWGIDAPEYDQPGAAGAENHLTSLVSGGEVAVTIRDRDRYGRSVAVVECRGVNVNEAMVRSGYAWVHPYFCKEIECKKWKKLESNARKNNLGLWRWDDPIPPWKWKANKR